MSGGTKPLLEGAPKSKENNEAKVYAIQFPNPFDESKKELDLPMKYSQARKQLFEIFKTSKKAQLPSKKRETEMKEAGDNNLGVKGLEKKSKDADVIPDMVKKSVSWLYDLESPTKETTRREFLKDAISAILFTIRYELNLNYSILLSRDKDELFCEVYATEEWLQLKAQAEEYRLQFRPQATSVEIENYPFKAVPPYAKYEIPERDIMFPDRVKRLFQHYDDDEKVCDSGSLFTYTDRVRLVRNSLNTKLDLHLMKEYEISIEDFCIHSEGPLQELKTEWATLRKIFSKQPLDKVRNYFGEKAALYFAWMETYQKFMISAAILGLGVQIIVFASPESGGDNEITLKQVSQVLFAIFLALWASTFDQVWTRKEKVYAWKWGTTLFYEEEEQRGAFQGEIHKDPVSNKMKRKRDDGILHNLRLFISYSVVFVFVISVAGVIGSILFLRYFLIGEANLTTLSLITAGVLNSLQIKFMDIIYSKIAVLLNDWENHETETAYNNKLATKVFIFKFVNSYSSLFYLAYFANEGLECKKNDEGCFNGMDALAIQLGIIFIVSVLFNVVEILVPFALMKRRVIAEDMHVKQMKLKDDTIRTTLYPIEKQAKCESYESPLEDYIEMIIEFGYVVMFATALPILPLFLLIEIIIEVRVDAWKICNELKRADPHRSEDIGVFKDIIVFMAYVGAINNAGLVVYAAGLFEAIVDSSDSFNDSNVVYLLIFIGLEHVLLFGMFLISVMIPDEPEVVRQGAIWSERIINEKLYQIVETRPNVDHPPKEDGKADIDFLLSEAKIKYEEGK